MIKKLSALLLLWSFAANAGLPPTTIQGQSDTSPKTKFGFQVPYSQFTDLGGIKALIETGNTNGLVNASFEHVAPATGWTAGLNVSSAVNTTSYVDGKQSLTLTASATISGAQLIWYQDWTPGSSLSGNNGEASLWVNTTASTLQVCPRVQGTTLVGQCVSVPGTGNWVKASTNFIFPTSGSVGVALYSTAGFLSGATIGSIDKGYVGLATNLSQVSQAQVFGTLKYASTSGCSWTVNSSTYTDFSANVSCATPTVTGNATVPGSKIPAIPFSVMPPGDYEFTINLNPRTVGADYMSCRLVDELGTQIEEWGFQNSNAGNYNQISQVTAKLSIATALSNKTYKLQCKGSGATDGITADSSLNAAFAPSLSFVVKYYPSQAQLAIKPDQTPASWSGYHTVSGGWTSSGTGIADLSAGTSPVLTPRTNRNFGTVSTAASNLPGIQVTFPRAGNYWICATGSVFQNTASGAPTIQLVDGSGTVITSPTLSTLASGAGAPFTVCGSYPASATLTTIKLKGADTAGTFTLNFTGVSSAIEWSIIELDAPMAAPYLTGSVTSNTSGQERSERAKLTLGANSCTIVGQSGSWISSAAGTAGANVCTITIASSTFSAAPMCTCSGADDNAAYCFVKATGASATSMTFVRNLDTGAASSGDINIHCQGPR